MTFDPGDVDEKLLLDRAIEPARDFVLRAASGFADKPATSPRIVVVDIDSNSLDTVALWPWPRETVADLVGNVGQDGSDLLEGDTVGDPNFFTAASKSDFHEKLTAVAKINWLPIRSQFAQGPTPEDMTLMC
ncbi:MAG: CHASE2 domain-containing protein [Sphingomonadales bacterium]|nr:CHASE2 domain-containing protein [Sphingomonadales bacterium]